jgi:hypothetical protein
MTGTMMRVSATVDPTRGVGAWFPQYAMQLLYAKCAGRLRESVLGPTKYSKFAALRARGWPRANFVTI